MHLDTPSKQSFAVVWAIAEVLIFGGIFFGWGSLVYILKADGVYTNICKEVINDIDIVVINNSFNSVLRADVHSKARVDVNFPSKEDGRSRHGDGISQEFSEISTENATLRTDKCTGQDKIFNLGFSIICALITFGTLATGQINYKLGTRNTRLISFVGFVVGALMVAFTTPELPWLVFPGMLLIGVAGFTIFFTNVQVAYLFERSRSIIVAMLTGALATSVATQQFVKIAYDNGVSLRSSYIFLACFHCVVLISTYGWLPKMFFLSKKTHKAEIKPGQKEIKVVAEVEELTESDGLTEDGRNKQVRETKVKSGLRSYTCSSSFYLHVLWFCILQLRFQYYIGTLNPYLSSISKDTDQVSELTNICLYVMMAGFVVALLSGAFYDYQVYRYKKYSDLRQQYGPAILPLIISSILGMLLSAIQMIRTIEAVYTSFVLITVFRGCLFSVATAYLGARFPSTHFGILHGIMNGTGGTISLLQYALFNWTGAYEGSLLHVNVFLICLTSVSLVHPLYQWCKLRKLKEDPESS